jgi:hypothetical protein
MDPQNAQVLQQPVNSQPIAQKEFRNESSDSNPFKKVLLIVLGFIVLLGVAGGSYYLGMKQRSSAIVVSNRKMISTSPTLATTNTPTNNPTPTSSPSANWQTYTSPSHTFSIKYPSIFYLDSTGRGADYIFNDKSTMNIYFSNFKGTPLTTNQLAITLLSTVENFNGNLQGLANRVSGGSQTNVPYTQVTLAGMTGIKTIYHNTVNDDVEEYAFSTTKGMIWLSAEPANSQFISQFEQMMQTLQISQ